MALPSISIAAPKFCHSAYVYGEKREFDELSDWVIISDDDLATFASCGLMLCLQFNHFPEAMLKKTVHTVVAK